MIKDGLLIFNISLFFRIFHLYRIHTCVILHRLSKSINGWKIFDNNIFLRCFDSREVKFLSSFRIFILIFNHSWSNFCYFLIQMNFPLYTSNIFLDKMIVIRRVAHSRKLQTSSWKIGEFMMKAFYFFSFKVRLQVFNLVCLQNLLGSSTRRYVYRTLFKKFRLGTI